MSTPPTAGPAATPAAAAPDQARTPIRRDEAASRRAAPTPCTQRAVINTARFGAAAQPADASRKSATPTGYDRARRTATRAIAVTATAALYDVSTQLTPTIVVLKSP